MKRVFDVAFTLLALAGITPLLMVIAALVKIKLGSPIFFTQDRPGRGGAPFRLYKFRTMREDRGADGFQLPDEDRLTGFGSWLRRTSLDELPELANVLKGDMSLVGPRPLLMEYLPLYSKEQARRHEVRPGLTGWAQVKGRNALNWEDKFALDLWYIDNWSFWLDVKILMLTVVAVFRVGQVSQEGHVTMEKFRGSG